MVSGSSSPKWSIGASGTSSSCRGLPDRGRCLRGVALTAFAPGNTILSEERTLKKPGELASEFIVIVVGVLVALGADAAWNERYDRVREREALLDLREEFIENESTLLRDIETNRAAQRAGQAWTAVMSERSAVSADSARALFLTAIQDARFDPGTGALRSIVDGGELGLITNSDLRRALAGWADRMDEARRTGNETGIQRSTLIPFLLSIPRDRPLYAGERTAVDLFGLLVAYQVRQQERLVEPTREILEQIERELGR